MNLIGTWKLISCSGRSSSGKAFLPYGENPTGHLTYTSSGKVIVTLMSSSRTNFHSENLANVTVEEKAAAFDSFDAYSGSVIVDEIKGTVIHRIEAGRVPNWVGKEHVRYFKISGNNLTLLTTPFELSDEEWQVEVIWERVK